MESPKDKNSRPDVNDGSAEKVVGRRNSEKIEILIEHLDRDREAIMRGRIFAEDSVEIVRQMREERNARLMGESETEEKPR